MSDDNYKKNQELEVLEYFNPIYEIINNDFLEVIETSERPDFICRRKNSALVGVEIVQVRRGHPNDVFYDKYINNNIYLPPVEAISIIQSIIYEKEIKRRTKDWKMPEASILIIQLKESPLCDIAGALTEYLFHDLSTYGFCEIWLADFSEIEAYNNIELFCLFPQYLSRYYKRPRQKPYG